MKRTKLLLSTIVSFLLAFVMVFAVACDSNTGSNGGGNNTDNNEDHGITDSSKDGLALDCISVSGYKKTFTLGDTFTTGDLVVTATLNDYSISDKYTTDVTLNAGEYVVDSSDYNANRVGVYTIYVSHTRSNVTRTAHYEVEVTAVTPAYGGIVAKLADGKTDTYSLSAGESSKVINKDILAVYEIGTNGETGETPVDPELYDAELYLGSKKMENNAATQNGVYSFVAILKADKSQQDFIPVYVINTVSAIELVDGVGTFAQVEGRDTISSTWQFTVTYSNGTTKTVKAGDAGLTVTLDTTVVGESKTANVSYVENDAKGTPHEVTCTVTYKITEKVISGETITGKVQVNTGLGKSFQEVFDAEDSANDNVPIEAGTYDLGSDDYVTVTTVSKGTSSAYRYNPTQQEEIDGTAFGKGQLRTNGNSESNHRIITIKFDSIVTGATITVYANTGSAGNTRYIGLFASSLPSIDKNNDKDLTAANPLAKHGFAAAEKWEITLDSIVSNGTYILGCAEGVNYYGIEVNYTGKGSTGGEQSKSYSYIVQDKDTAADSIAASGSLIDSNDIFTATIDTALSKATLTGMDSTTDGCKGQYVKDATLLDGTTPSCEVSGATYNGFVTGYKCTSNITAASADGEEGGKVIITVTATVSAEITLYMGFANDSYNSNRNGKAVVKQTGKQNVEYTVANRQTLFGGNATPMTITLAAGESVTIEIINMHTSTAKLWYWGAEAKTV